MARPFIPPDGKNFEFPATSGSLAGWSSLVLCVAGIVALAMNVQTLVGLRLGLALALFGVLSYAFLLRPRIRVRDGALVLVNPLSEVRIPLGLVSRVTVRSATYVFVGDKRYVGVAVGRKVRQMVGGRGVASVGLTPLGLGMGRRLPVAESTPTREESIPDLLEQWVHTRVEQSREFGGEPGETVQSQPLWWVIVTATVLALVIAGTFAF